jgi:hypothetical protein
MTKKVEPGERLNFLNGDEHAHRVSEVTGTQPCANTPLQAHNPSSLQVVLHNSNQTENERAALQLIHTYFVARKGSTHHYLAQFIAQSGQTLNNFDAVMYANENNLFFRRTVEGAYADGLYWQHKQTSFIRVWRNNGTENYVCAANFNMIGKFRRKKYSKPEAVPQEVQAEAIRQLKIALLVVSQ